MKRFLFAGAVAAIIASAASGAEPTLDTSSLDAYRASLVAMSEPLGPEGARKLLLHLVTIATGAEDPQAAMRAMRANPNAFLDALDPFDGKTAAEIMAADQR